MMESRMEDLEVREATLADKEAVLNVHDNVFEGSDYLPVYYDHFIASPDITPFVILHENKIVGYMAAHIVDDGQTVVTRAARLNPETEGKGFYGYMGKRIEEWAKSKNVTMKAFGTSDANPNIAKDSFRSVHTMVTNRQILIYVTDAEKLLQIPDQDLESDISTVPDDLLATYIRSDTIRKNLFPQDRVIVDYLPCKLLESNIRFMKGPDDFTTRLSDVQVTDDHCTGLLSFGTIYPCKENTILHCTLEIYGTRSSEASFRKHVKKHLSVMKQKAIKAGIQKAMVRFGAGLEKGMPSEELEKVFNEFGAKRITWKDFNLPHEMYVEGFSWEKNL